MPAALPSARGTPAYNAPRSAERLACAVDRRSSAFEAFVRLFMNSEFCPLHFTPLFLRQQQGQ
jgi:hypothetical protein